jgi:hypothetical protein
MTRYTRQEAKQLGLPTCYGSTCIKHPELDGLRRVSGSCVACARELLQKTRKENPDRIKEYRKTSHKNSKANPESWAKKLAADKLYKEKNKDKCYALKINWNAKNPDKVKAASARTKVKRVGKTNAETAFRRNAKMQRTPKWLTEFDKLKMHCIYQMAAMYTRVNQESWTVDHVIPLQGKIVSGLHVPANLQVMRASDNFSKGNRFEVSA